LPAGAATAQDLIDRTLVERRFYLTLMAALSLVALILAGTGVYGLMSMSTGQRAHEIGIRMALGSMYERTGALEPLTLARVVAVLTAVALLAAFVPALRSARVDPMAVPRSE